MWFKKNKWKIIIPLALVIILAAAFIFGGNAPGAKNIPDKETDSPEPTVSATIEQSSEPELTSKPEQSPEPTVEPSVSPEVTPSPGETAEPTASPDMSGGNGGMEIDPETGKDKYGTDPVPEGKPLPVEPQDAETSDVELKCKISISCATILDNMDYCDPDKVELVPDDGWILAETEVTFYEGESVFNVLQRTCKQNKIHMEFSSTPIYNSAYIEGIANLYEFDVGELSGWMYSVNDWYPNYGCSRYQLSDGDVIKWVFTCDLGSDVGGGSAFGTQS